MILRYIEKKLAYTSFSQIKFKQRTKIHLFGFACTIDINYKSEKRKRATELIKWAISPETKTGNFTNLQPRWIVSYTTT